MRSNTPIRLSGGSIRKNSSVNNQNKIHETFSNEIKNYENHITELNSNISIRNIWKMFQIKLEMFNIKKEYLSSLNMMLSKEKNFSFEVEAKIYCGSEEVSKGIKFPWKGQLSSTSSMLQRTLIFDIMYCNLPIFSSLIVKFKALLKTKGKKEIEKKTIAWLNFRLFDHLKILKTGNINIKLGLHKYSLWSTKFSEESYFISDDNNENNHIGDVYFELESFIRPVEYQNHNEEVDLYRPHAYSVSQEDEQILENVLRYAPYQALTEKEKMVIWINRNYVVKIPKLIPRLCNCVDKSDFREVDTLEKLILVIL
jgi:hypothetical protein